jgi:putative transposase
MNLKKVYRLYCEERLTVRKRGGRKRALGTRAPMAIPQEPNQRWSLDFVSDALARGPAVPLAQRHRRLQPGVPGVHRRYLVVRQACRSGAGRHRRTSRAAVHGGQ